MVKAKKNKSKFDTSSNILEAFRSMSFVNNGLDLYLIK